MGIMAGRSYPFGSSKRIGPISTGHRQYLDTGHCAWLHGYGRYVRFNFAGDIDERMWVVDFGDLRDVKAIIEDAWDHKFLISSADPELERIRALEEFNIIRVTVMDAEQGHGPGIEGSCKWVFDTINPMIVAKTEGRAWISKVEIWEHENNSAWYEPNEGEIATEIAKFKAAETLLDTPILELSGHLDAIKTKLGR